MTNSADKTVPYQPSAADLENLRRLRRKTNPSWRRGDDIEEEKTRGNIDTQETNTNQPIQKSEKNIP
jgi:hypothetical protein